MGTPNSKPALAPTELFASAVTEIQRLLDTVPQGVLDEEDAVSYDNMKAGFLHILEDSYSFYYDYKGHINALRENCQNASISEETKIDDFHRTFITEQNNGVSLLKNMRDEMRALLKRVIEVYTLATKMRQVFTDKYNRPNFISTMKVILGGILLVAGGLLVAAPVFFAFDKSMGFALIGAGVVIAAPSLSLLVDGIVNKSLSPVQILEQIREHIENSCLEIKGAGNTHHEQADTIVAGESYDHRNLTLAKVVNFCESFDVLTNAIHFSMRPTSRVLLDMMKSLEADDAKVQTVATIAAAVSTAVQRSLLCPQILPSVV